MSYTEHYDASITISGTVHGSVRYPASETGGTISYSKDYSKTEPIHVKIHVDTDPFDGSVRSCNNYVHGLTGAVVATEAAEIKAKYENSIKVGDAVVRGFFNVIGYDLRSQIS